MKYDRIADIKAYIDANGTKKDDEDWAEVAKRKAQETDVRRREYLESLNARAAK